MPKTELKLAPLAALLFIVAAMLTVSSASASARPLVERVPTAYGTYFKYVPQGAKKVLVIVHGSMAEDESAEILAQRFIGRFTRFADQHGFVLIAPAFNRADYQSYGGYRGLFGRKIGADAWVNHLVDRFTKNRRFYLYGHSAGGQFVVRYAVRHPKRIIRAVASAPGRYAFPDRTVPWPYGAGPFQRTLSYKNPAQTKKENVRPRWDGFVEASQLPLTVVVGSKDLEPQPKRPGHLGKTRVALAQNWARAMRGVAAQHGKRGRTQVLIVPGVGHSSRGLTPSCSQLLGR